MFGTITRLHNLWGSLSPVLLHGFIDKAMAAQLLLKTPTAGAGTFLIRFSARHPGSLAVLEVRFCCCVACAFGSHSRPCRAITQLAFLDHMHDPGGAAAGRAPRLEVTHCLLDVLERKHKRGACRYRLYFAGTGEQNFRTLEEVLLNCGKLTHLYPNHKKVRWLCPHTSPSRVQLTRKGPCSCVAFCDTGGGVQAWHWYPCCPTHDTTSCDWRHSIGASSRTGCSHWRWRGCRCDRECG